MYQAPYLILLHLIFMSRSGGIATLPEYLPSFFGPRLLGFFIQSRPFQEFDIELGDEKRNCHEYFMFGEEAARADL